jgi:hypothetical protein
MSETKTGDPISLKVEKAGNKRHPGIPQFGFITSVTNNTTRPVQSFKGLLKVTAENGEFLESLRVSYDFLLNAGETVTAGFWYNVESYRLGFCIIHTPLKNLTIEWELLETQFEIDPTLQMRRRF